MIVPILWNQNVCVYFSCRYLFSYFHPILFSVYWSWLSHFKILFSFVYRNKMSSPSKQRLKRQAWCKRLMYKRVPITSWLPLYNSEKALADFIAGITVGLTVIPQALAYATLAGLDPQVIFYTCIQKKKTFHITRLSVEHTVFNQSQDSFHSSQLCICCYERISIRLNG